MSEKDILISKLKALLMDAEGSINVSGTPKAQIIITNVNTDFLKSVRAVFKCGKIYKRTFYKGHHKQQPYAWIVSAEKDVSRILTEILPYLKVHRKKAEEALRRLKGDLYLSLISEEHYDFSKWLDPPIDAF